MSSKEDLKAMMREVLAELMAENSAVPAQSKPTSPKGCPPWLREMFQAANSVAVAKSATKAKAALSKLKKAAESETDGWKRGAFQVAIALAENAISGEYPSVPTRSLGKILHSFGKPYGSSKIHTRLFETLRDAGLTWEAPKGAGFYVTGLPGKPDTVRTRKSAPTVKADEIPFG